MRALKTVVIAMGVLIVGGIAVLVALMAGRLGTSAPAARGDTPYAPATVEIPRGSAVVATRIEGDRLILHVRLEGGDMRFVVVNLGTGKEIGVVDVREGRGKAP
jgi:hypothetical protein